MARKMMFASLAVVLAMAQLVIGADHGVGGPKGSWDLSTNLQQWATSQSFLVGDNLIFQYTPVHDVLEVSKADYDSCQVGNPIQTHTGGNTIIPLTSPGKRYFVCGTTGHCSQGMKLEIDTVAPLAPSPVTPPPFTPTPPTRPPSSNSPSSSPKVPPSKSPSLSPKVPPLKSPSPSPKNSPSPSPTAISTPKSPMVAPSKSPSSSHSPRPSPSSVPTASPSTTPSVLSGSPSSSLPRAGSAPVPSPSAATGGGMGTKAAMEFGVGMITVMLLIAL